MQYIERLSSYIKAHPRVSYTEFQLEREKVLTEMMGASSVSKHNNKSAFHYGALLYIHCDKTTQNQQHCLNMAVSQRNNMHSIQMHLLVTPVCVAPRYVLQTKMLLEDFDRDCLPFVMSVPSLACKTTIWIQAQLKVLQGGTIMLPPLIRYDPRVPQKSGYLYPDAARQFDYYRSRDIAYLLWYVQFGNGVHFSECARDENGQFWFRVIDWLMIFSNLPATLEGYQCAIAFYECALGSSKMRSHIRFMNVRPRAQFGALKYDETFIDAAGFFTQIFIHMHSDFVKAIKHARTVLAQQTKSIASTDTISLKTDVSKKQQSEAKVSVIIEELTKDVALGPDNIPSSPLQSINEQSEIPNQPQTATLHETNSSCAQATENIVTMQTLTNEFIDILERKQVIAQRYQARDGTFVRVYPTTELELAVIDSNLIATSSLLSTAQKWAKSAKAVQLLKVGLASRSTLKNNPCIMELQTYLVHFFRDTTYKVMTEAMKSIQTRLVQLAPNPKDYAFRLVIDLAFIPICEQDPDYTTLGIMNTLDQLRGESQTTERNACIARFLEYQSVANTKCVLLTYMFGKYERLYEVTQATRVVGPYSTNRSAACAIQSITDTWTPTLLDVGRVSIMKHQKLRHYVTAEYLIETILQTTLHQHHSAVIARKFEPSYGPTSQQHFTNRVDIESGTQFDFPGDLSRHKTLSHSSRVSLNVNGARVSPPRAEDLGPRVPQTMCTRNVRNDFETNSSRPSNASNDENVRDEPLRVDETSTAKLAAEEIEIDIGIVNNTATNDDALKNRLTADTANTADISMEIAEFDLSRSCDYVYRANWLQRCGKTLRVVEIDDKSMVSVVDMLYIHGEYELGSKPWNKLLGKKELKDLVIHEVKLASGGKPVAFVSLWDFDRLVLPLITKGLAVELRKAWGLIGPAAMLGSSRLIEIIKDNRASMLAFVKESPRAAAILWGQLIEVEKLQEQYVSPALANIQSVPVESDALQIRKLELLNAIEVRRLELQSAENIERTRADADARAREAEARARETEARSKAREAESNAFKAQCDSDARSAEAKEKTAELELRKERLIQGKNEDGSARRLDLSMQSENKRLDEHAPYGGKRVKSSSEDTEYLSSNTTKVPKYRSNCGRYPRRYQDELK